MTADGAGNDILAVGVPVTGSIGFAPYGTVIPTSSEGKSNGLVLNPAFVKIGLLKTDGGPQFAWAADGDPIEFWQDGYSLPSGLANVTLAITAAEVLADQVRAIIAGIQPNGDGYLEVDGGGHSTRWVAFTEEIFKNGAIRRRVAPHVTLKSSAEDKSTRGEVNGNALVFDIQRHASIGNKHFGEWVLPALGAAAPTIDTVLPASKGAGSTVDIVGTGFTGATGVTFAAIASPLFTVKSSTLITAALPVGSAGSAPVIVTTPVGSSAAKAYTRIV